MRDILIGVLISLILFFFPGKCLWSQSKGYQFFLGPEIYYVKRQKEGGAEQTGVLYGVRGGYEKIKRYKFYYALDGLYSTGILEGKTNHKTIKSEFSNSNVETRFGYTLQAKYWPCFSFTPFVGVGYMWEYSRYLHPSPMRVHFDNQFPYIPFGFLTSFLVTDRLQMGLNFKARFLWEGKQKVTHDPQYSSLEQCYEQHLQYRVEIPLEYFFNWNQHALSARLTAFYEYRHYGHWINYPFDFLDTTFKFYGANFELLYHF